MNALSNKMKPASQLGLGLLTITSAQALMYLGNSAVFLDLETKLTYDSNIFTNNLEEEDFIAMARPTLRYTRNESVFDFETTLGGEFAQFFDMDDQSYEDWFASISLSGPNREGSALTFGLTGEWREETTAREELSTRVEREIKSVAGTVGFSLSDKSSLRLSAGYSDIDYENVLYTDSEDTSGRLDGLWHYSEKLSSYVSYRYREI